MTAVESVVTEIGLTHPIVYDIYDLCDYVKEGKLNYFTVSMLKEICTFFELIQPAFCMYLYIQCDKRGTPKNQFTYKTLCSCRMKKKYRKIANEKNRVQ